MNNSNTIFGERAYRKSKAICHQLALDDPATILKAMAALPKADQHALGYIRAKALRFQEIARRNYLG